MKVTTTLEDGDIELILSAPPTPCTIKCCPNQHSCTGCAEERAWQESYGEKIRKRGLEQMHLTYQMLRAKQEQVRHIEKECRALHVKLVSQGFDVPAAETDRSII